MLSSTFTSFDLLDVFIVVLILDLVSREGLLLRSHHYNNKLGWHPLLLCKILTMTHLISGKIKQAGQDRVFHQLYDFVFPILHNSSNNQH